MKKELLRYYFLLSVLISTLIGCNTIPDGVKQNSSELIQNQVEKNYKIDTVFIFNRTKGYTVDFKGTRTSKLTADGFTVSGSDSIYRRITCLGDTILDLTDSTYGLVEFRLADVTLWDSLFSKIKYEYGVIGVVVAEYLNPDDLQTIDSSQSFSLLTSSTKKAVIKTLNDILETNDLYLQQKDAIETDIFYIPVMDSLFADVRRLVGENVFLDTSGTVNPDMSFFQQEKLKWFNWRIITQYLDNEPNAIDNGKLFKKYSTAGRVYTFLFQQGPTQAELSKNDIIRFISLRSDGLYQIAYQDENGFSVPTDNKITDFPYVCDVSWTATPLTWFPQVPVKQGKATLKYSSFIIDIDTLWHYDLKLFYPLIGTVMENDEPVRIAGTLNTTFGFFKSSSRDLDRHQGYFTRWDTDIEIQMIDANETITKYNETHVLVSDDGPYSECF